jgi:spermidine/putrescine transport system substrate-binding protein
MVSGDADAFNKIRSGQANIFDLVNLNNPWANIFYDAGYLRPLDEETFGPYYDNMIDRFKRPYKWAHSFKDGQLLGMVQRFGPMSFVINTDKISKATANNEGANIVLEPSMKNRYGVLDFPYETIYMLCVIAGANPYAKKTEAELAKCKAAIRETILNAKLIGSPAALNNALLNDEIDMYVAGGTFTVSSLRRDGFPQFRAVSPAQGPIEGKGGTAYVEITSVVNNPNLSPIAGDFLHYMQTPEGSLAVARSGTSLNPVGNIHQIADQMDADELMAIQYDDLEEHMALCAEFEPTPDYDELIGAWEQALQERG